MPHPRLARAALLALSCSLGCLEEQRYQDTSALVQLTADAQPAYVTEDDDPIYRVDLPFELRITPPSSEALAKLSAQSNPPDPRLPWVSLHDLDLQLDYALQNDSDQSTVAMITLNGINEFRYYAPGPENFHQWERRVALAPHQRVTGTVTEEELDEIAVDLATAANGAPNSNLVVERRSQSSLDPRVQPYIPRVVPGLVGIRAGIETGRALPLTLAITLRVQDHGERAAKRGETRWELPVPQPFVPVVPEVE